MKTILAIIGSIVVLGIIVLGVGGYWAYKKAGGKFSEMAQKQVEEFIVKKAPPEETANLLRRTLNAGMGQKGMAKMAIISLPVRAIQDETVSEVELGVLKEGADLGEQPEVSMDKLQVFMKKVDYLMPMERGKPGAAVPPAKKVSNVKVGDGSPLSICVHAADCKSGTCIYEDSGEKGVCKAPCKTGADCNETTYCTRLGKEGMVCVPKN